jgi:hypothetical protein
MAMTVRLPADLARRGRRYAGKLGVSLNALLAIALREYLDARSPQRAPAHCQGRSPKPLHTRASRAHAAKAAK